MTEYLDGLGVVQEVNYGPQRNYISKEYYKTSVVTHIVMSRLDSNSPFRFIY